MPSKKGRKIASRHGQINQRAKRKVTSHSLSRAQLQGPQSQSNPEDIGTMGNETSSLHHGMVSQGSNEQPRPLSTRARRELHAIAVEAGPSLKSEVIRIGIIALFVGLALTGLKLSAVLG